MTAIIGYFLPVPNASYPPKPGIFFALAPLILENKFFLSQLLFLFNIISEC
jgi:hypothetical protein